MLKRAPSRPKQPCSTLIQERFQGKFFFFLVVVVFVNLLILCFIENFMARHCHFAIVCSCRNFGHGMIWWRIIV